MMKFFYGSETYLLDQELKKIIDDSLFEPLFFDYDSSVDSLILEFTTFNLFSNNKLIIVKNHTIFADLEVAKKILKFLQTNDIKNNFDIVFVFEEDKINYKNELIKFLLAHAKVQKFAQINSKQITSLIKELVKSKGGKISNSAAIKFSLKVPPKLRIIVSEVEKLLMQTKEINDHIIETSLGEYLRDDYFVLTNAIVSHLPTKIISAYQERKLIGDEPIAMIGQIASILNLAILVNSFHVQGMSKKDIATQSGIHIYRVQKALELISLVSIVKIEALVFALTKLENDIKSGKIDANFGFLFFLLKLIR